MTLAKELEKKISSNKQQSSSQCRAMLRGFCLTKGLNLNQEIELHWYTKMLSDFNLVKEAR